MAAFSTHNYQTILQKLKDAKVLRRRYLVNILSGVNVIWFWCVVVYDAPVTRLSAIVAIYATFVIANLIQISRSAASCGTSRLRAELALQGSAFLREENAPTLFAYTLVVLLVTMTPHIAAVDEKFVKIFVGGVAAFHLGLSIVKYWIAIRRNPVDDIWATCTWTSAAFGAVKDLPRKMRWCKIVLIICIVVTSVVIIAHNYEWLHICLFGGKTS